MMNLDNTNIRSLERLVTPEKLKQRLPVDPAVADHIANSRQAVRDILDRRDPRMMVVVGPCSVHDTKAALDYATILKQLADEVSDHVYVVMRVYFEKPRTTVGWKGLINDPDLNGSFNIAKGLSVGRELMLEINRLGLPIANEALDPISPQYLQDLITWSAIGARTTESQTHREMASGLSVPIGFKNGTDGSLDVAINALQSVSSPHSFLGIDHEGQVSIINSAGNPHAHIVLRGGGGQANYDSVNIALTEQALHAKDLPANIMVDCSHANSGKDASLQPLVLENVTNQILEGNTSIVGVMLESHLEAGNQKLGNNLDELRYGVSITDACIDWQTTESAILTLRDKLADFRAS
jgi:3-deoxy-7-phosphoheptulonate synthase